MAFNRIVDRKIDARNPRTAERELPSGRLSLREAWVFFGLNALGFLLVAWLLNPLCGMLAPVALVVILGYSYTKRFTPLSHFVLGLGLGLAPVGAWLAAAGGFALPPVLLGLVVLFWVAGFDILYALQDEEFDRRMGLRSIPARLGMHTSLRLSALVHGLSALLLLGTGFLADLGTYFWVGWAGFVLALVLQHRLVRLEGLSRINQAFFTANGWASLWLGFWAVFDVLMR
jgi:4-hydroxybenzoate polyprenyltransferase